MKERTTTPCWFVLLKIATTIFAIPSRKRPRVQERKDLDQDPGQGKEEVAASLAQVEHWYSTAHQSTVRAMVRDILIDSIVNTWPGLWCVACGDRSRIRSPSLSAAGIIGGYSA